MKQQAIDILDEMIAEFMPKTEFSVGIGQSNNAYYHGIQALNEAKSRIQALGAGWIPFETPPEKEGTYLTYGDDLNNNVGPRIMNYVNGSFECGDGAEFPTHWKHIGSLPLPPNK